MQQRERERVAKEMGRENRNDVPNMAKTLCFNSTRHTIEYDATAEVFHTKNIHFSIEMQLTLDALDSHSVHSSSVFLFSFSFGSLVRWPRIATYMCLNRWHCEIQHIYIQTQHIACRRYVDGAIIIIIINNIYCIIMYAFRLPNNGYLHKWRFASVSLCVRVCEHNKGNVKRYGTKFVKKTTTMSGMMKRTATAVAVTTSTTTTRNSVRENSKY